MIYKVRLTDEAKQDLRDIYEYIAFSLHEPTTADSVQNRIVTTLASLKDLPERHPVYSEEPWKSRNCRRINIKNYSAFYVVFENEIRVIRIFYGARDLSNILIETSDEEQAANLLVSE